MLNLTCNSNLITKICEFFLQRPFLKVEAAIFKSLLLKMAATVMTVEFGTSTIILAWRKILKLVCAVL